MLFEYDSAEADAPMVWETAKKGGGGRVWGM